MSFEKAERDGMIAVLISPGFGAGWFTWNKEHEGLLFDKEIVDAVEAGNRDKAAEIAEQKYPGGYWGGAKDLRVVWLHKGTSFRVDEYDGSESLHHEDDRTIVA